LAFIKARKRKTLRSYVTEFESEPEANLKELQHELMTFTYTPHALTTFIVRDPKTRKISSSHFRDRIVHHALCNIIAPIFERNFIHDSFANQKGKGTHLAIKRAEKFIRKVAPVTNPRGGGGQHKLFEKKGIIGYALKADVSHYFDSIDHEVLLEIVKRKIKDAGVIWLIETILGNHKTEAIGKGMPIGNLTSQFFANVYLNELDWFVKHKLKAKYYIRYVDDFVILHRDPKTLKRWKGEIGEFLVCRLKVQLHPEKSRIIALNGGITMLGFRIFGTHRLLKKSNARRIWKRMEIFKRRCDMGETTKEKVARSLDGWLAYAQFANTYNLRTKVIAKANDLFS